MYQNLAILAAFLLVYSTFAGAFESRLLSGPLLFLLFGLLLGPAGLGVLELRVDKEGLRTLAELTLALVLFSDAANADLGVLRAHEGLPLRLLLIGLPLTILGGWLVGLWLLPEVPPLELAVLATLLAPTDAALGKAVVSNPLVPTPVREGLNVESGLNDGICVPVLLLFLALIAEEQLNAPLLLAFRLLAGQLGIGLLVGLLLPLLAWGLQRLSRRENWQIPRWSQLVLPGLALLCFATAQVLGGSGFIAAFSGGLFSGYLFRQDKQRLLEAGEGFSEALSIFTWIVFGALVAPKASSIVSVEVWLYAIASLTVIRVVPVLVSLAGMRLDLETRLFIGWFGPRGLATIVFAVLILDEHLQRSNTLISTAIATVVLSVVLHGLSATPWARRLGARAR